MVLLTALTAAAGALRRPAHARRDDDRGAVALLVAAFSVVLLGVAALVVDLGYARDLQRRAQNAADAAALAAATCMALPAGGCATHDAAAARANGYVTANGWNATGTQYTYDDTAGTVAVALQGTRAPSFFSGVVGGGRPTVSASARATWKGQTAGTCVFCVLGDYQGQVGDVTLGGGLLVNGALTFNNGGGTVTLTGPGAVGYHGSWNGLGAFTVNGAATAPVQYAPAFADPYLNLQLPPSTADSVDLTVAAARGAGTCAPGVYTDLSGCTSLSGNGVYVVVGSGTGVTSVTVNGPDAANTLIYLTCHQLGADGKTYYSTCSSTNQNGAQLAGTGNTTITINGRTSGTYQGFAVVYDRALTVTPKLAGNGQLRLAGTLYGAKLTLDLRGNGTGSILGQGNVVVGGVLLKGNGSGKEHIDVPGNGTPVAALTGPASPVHLIP